MSDIASNPLAEPLRNLLDGIHAGRFVMLSNSKGLCTSLIDAGEMALTQALLDENKAAESYKLNANKSVAVSNVTFWNANMEDCPRGCKVQLLGRGGVAVYSNYDGDSFWKKWAPLPRNRP